MSATAWLGIACCAILVLLWPLGFWKRYIWFAPTFTIGLYPGYLGFWWNGLEHAVSDGGELFVQSSRGINVFHRPKLFLEGDGRWSALIPLWMIFLPTAVLTMFLWRWSRYRHPGHCRKCGYDLTGHVSGKCPECGTEVA